MSSSASIPPADSQASAYGTLPPASTPSQRKPVSLPRLRELHQQGEKITRLTAYDATFAAVARLPQASDAGGLLAPFSH